MLCLALITRVTILFILSVCVFLSQIPGGNPYSSLRVYIEEIAWNFLCSYCSMFGLHTVLHRANSQLCPDSIPDKSPLSSAVNPVDFTSLWDIIKWQTAKIERLCAKVLEVGQLPREITVLHGDTSTPPATLHASPLPHLNLNWLYLKSGMALMVNVMLYWLLWASFFLL